MIELCSDLLKYSVILVILLGFIISSIVGAVILFFYVRDIIIKFSK